MSTDKKPSNIKVYSNGLKFNKGKLRVNKTSSDVAKAIIGLVEDIEKRSNALDVLKAIYNYMGNLESRSFPIDEVEINSSDYFSLNSFSKKKLLVKKLIEKYPDKKQRKEILKNAIIMQNWDPDISEGLEGIGGDPILLNLAELFTKTDNLSMSYLSENFKYEMDSHYQQIFIQLLKNLGIPDIVISKFEKQIGKSKENEVIKKNTSNIVSKENSSLIETKSFDRKGNSDFNPMIYDLDLSFGLKLFNLNRFKEIYKKFFFKIVCDFIDKLGLEKPNFNELLLLQKNKLKQKNKIDINPQKEKNESQEIFQYIIEWNIGQDFSEKDLEEIVKMLNYEGCELNLNPTNKKEVFSHPVKTSEGIQNYSGHFQNNGNHFLGESLIIIEDEKTKKKKLRLTLNDFTQDLYICFLTQISHYIKKKNFIDRNQLYFNMYDRYNKEIYNSENNYDISFFEKQYKKLMEKVIIPLSLEGKELGIKTHNTLLAGIYGSGKSQFLLKLLKDKKFIINGKEFNLNANVVYLDLQSFKAILGSPIGGIRTKLDEIYQKTNTPILLVIEDIDTLINEKMLGVNDEIAQAMTLFFEGIGSIPINVVATANEPSKLSERLIRPNRIYEIIEFYLPTNEEKSKILDLHLKEKGIKLDKCVKKKLIKTKVFKEGTASHIATFCEQLKSKLKTEEILGNKDFTLTEDIILKIAESINISSKDIEQTVQRIQKWVGEVTGNSSLLKGIGFINTTTNKKV